MNTQANLLGSVFKTIQTAKNWNTSTANGLKKIWSNGPTKYLCRKNDPSTKAGPEEKAFYDHKIIILEQYVIKNHT